MKHPYIKTEAEAAALVVDYLTGMGMEVFQEVQLGSSVADLVAVRGLEVWVVEVKMTWSLALLEQLREHKRRCHGHRIFAAVPQSREDRARQGLFKDLGFGSITIRHSPEEWARKTAVEVMASRVTSHPLPDILGKLCEGHKTHAKAGAPCAAGRYTPFRRTCDALAELVKKTPGLCMKEAMKAIKHHYSSDACARSSMAVWAKAGKVPGVKVVHEGRKLLLFPSEVKE